MLATTPRRPRRPRRHGTRLEPPERRALERTGWRTTLEYREDHVRGRDGRLVEVRSAWIAEAEHSSGHGAVLRVVASTPEAAWAELTESVSDAVGQGRGTSRPHGRLVVGDTGLDPMTSTV